MKKNISLFDMIVAAMLFSGIGIILRACQGFFGSSITILSPNEINLLFGTLVVSIVFFILKQPSVASAVWAAAAGIFFYSVDGKFGIGKVANYWDPLVFGLLIGSIIAVVILLLCKLPGFASFFAAAAPGLAIAAFFIGMNGARGAYWHFADQGYEEKGLDPKYMTFLLMMVVAFILGEIAVYTRKYHRVKE